MLDAGQSGVFHAHVAEHLRRQPALGIETLQLLLKVDAAQVQRFHARRRLAIHLARDPGKILFRLHVLQQAVGVLAGHAGQQRRGGLLVGDFTGHGEDRIDLNGHGQRLPVAVVNNAALRRDLHRALLLAIRPLHPFAIVQHLQNGQPHHNDQRPDKQECTKLEEARLNVNGGLGACCHRLHLHRQGTWKVPCAKTGNAGRTGDTERAAQSCTRARSAQQHWKKTKPLHVSKVIQRLRPVQAMFVQNLQPGRHSPGIPLSSERR